MTAPPTPKPTEAPKSSQSPKTAQPTEAPLSVQVLQTAAALENLAVLSYASAAELPVVTRGSVRLRAAVARNGAHHTAHARAFNQALLQAGAARQLAPDPRYLATVRRRLASIEDPASLADLLTELESVNAQTCTRFAILAQDRELRSLLVDVASVEAQHSSELLVLRTLLDSGHAGPGPAEAAVRAVPATVGTAGIPYTVYPTAGASAINEGTVR